MGIDVDGLVVGFRVVGIRVVGFPVVGFDVGLDDDGLVVGFRVVGLRVGIRVRGRVFVNGRIPSSINCASPVKRRYQSDG